MKVGDYVGCERLGKGSFKILRESHKEYTVQSEDGAEHQIYKVHCHRLPVPVMMALRKQEQDRQAKQADTIGRPHKRK